MKKRFKGKRDLKYLEKKEKYIIFKEKKTKKSMIYI